MNFEQVDRVPEDVLNRILWNAMKSAQPYPQRAAGAYHDEEPRALDAVPFGAGFFGGRGS